jgi:hypothetical protein
MLDPGMDTHAIRGPLFNVIRDGGGGEMAWISHPGSRTQRRWGASGGKTLPWFFRRLIGLLGQGGVGVASSGGPRGLAVQKFLRP